MSRNYDDRLAIIFGQYVRSIRTEEREYPSGARSRVLVIEMIGGDMACGEKIEVWIDGMSFLSVLTAAADKIKKAIKE